MGKKNNKKQTTAAPTKKTTESKVANDTTSKEETTITEPQSTLDELVTNEISASNTADVEKASVNVGANILRNDENDDKLVNISNINGTAANEPTLPSVADNSNVEVSKQTETETDLVLPNVETPESTQLHSKLLADMDQSTLASDVSESKLLSEVEEMESLCMNCHANGITRFMMHKIPYFRELIIASFRCEECGEYNNEVTFGGEIQIQGCHYELNITKAADLDRQLIKSDSATIRIPNIDFEIPPATQKGEISTIEGFLRTASKNLGLYQIERMADNPIVGEKVQDIIDVLDQMASGSYLPFRIMVDDPSGNSFIQNPYAPTKDPQMKIGFYFRTPAQDLSLGLQPPGQKEGGAQGSGIYKDDKDSNFKALITGPGFGQNAVTTSDTSTTNVSDTDKNSADSNGIGSNNHTTEHSDNGSNSSSVYESESSVRLGRSEVVSIPSPCPNCSAPGESLTALTDIPHFKEMIIMAFDCQLCGYKNSEIRGGGAVPTVGTQVSLRVLCMEDLKRDVLKSDSAMVLIPELELELSHGTLGGIFTTVEGLLNKISKNLVENNPFAVGDSTTLHHSTSTAIPTMKAKFATFLDALEIYAKGQKFPFTLILRDPLGNSFISAPLGSFRSPEEDGNIVLEDFTRSFDENEEFGLNDINTRDYETGVEEAAYSDVVLADRLTQPVRKTVDHPTFFAKGMEDSTPGGQCFTSGGSDVSGSRNWSTQGEREIPESYYKNIAKEKSSVMNNNSNDNNDTTESATPSEWYSSAAVPLGWSALKPGEDHTFGNDEDEGESNAGEKGNVTEVKMGGEINEEVKEVVDAVVESPVVRVVKEVTVVEQITNNKPFSTEATSPTITAPTTLTTATTLTTITTAKSAAVTSAHVKTTTTTISTDLAIPPSTTVTIVPIKEPNGDNTLDDDGYVASTTFTGAKLGYVYKVGTHGVGYYKDHSAAASAAAVVSAVAEVTQQQQVSKKQKQDHEIEINNQSNILTSDNDDNNHSNVSNDNSVRGIENKSAVDNESGIDENINNDKAKSFIRYSLDRPISSSSSNAGTTSDNADGDDESRSALPSSIVDQVTSSYGLVALASVTAVVAVALVILLRKR